MQVEMHTLQKHPLEIYRDLVSSGVFEWGTQSELAFRVGVDQGTISRIASGRFQRVTKSVVALCKYAGVSTLKTTGVDHFRSMWESDSVKDPEKKKLMEIIELAVDLLKRP